MFFRDIFSRTRHSIRRLKPPVLYSAVVDTSNYTLLAIGTYTPALLFLNESTMDTEYVPSATLADDVLLVIKPGPRAYPELSWDSSKRTFKKTNPAIVTEDMRERAVFASRKAQAIAQVIRMINRFRSRISTGFLFQEVIYAEKERQARGLKDAGFAEKSGAEAPYVVQYADFCGIPLRQAAEEILLQAQLDHEHLAKTEKIRLALFKKIRLAKTKEELDEIINTYRDDGVV